MVQKAADLKTKKERTNELPFTNALPQPLPLAGEAEGPGEKGAALEE